MFVTPEYNIGKPNTESFVPVPTPYENKVEPMNDVPWYTVESPKLTPLVSNTSKYGF